MAHLYRAWNWVYVPFGRGGRQVAAVVAEDHRRGRLHVFKWRDTSRAFTKSWIKVRTCDALTIDEADPVLRRARAAWKKLGRL